MPLEGIDDIHSGDSLPLGVFGVGDGITDDVLKENLEDTAGLLVEQARDTLDTTTSRQTADGGLGDTLDVITQNFAVTLGASLSESFASFASSSHVELSNENDVKSLCYLPFNSQRADVLFGILLFSSFPSSLDTENVCEILYTKST